MPIVASLAAPASRTMAKIQQHLATNIARLSRRTSALSNAPKIRDPSRSFSSPKISEPCLNPRPLLRIDGAFPTANESTIVQRDSRIRRHFHTGGIGKMASDEDYAAFLDKANQDTGGATTQSKQYGTKSVNTAVPKALEQVEEYYTSDADEPFEPVSLTYSGKDSVSAGKLAASLWR